MWNKPKTWQLEFSDFLLSTPYLGVRANTLSQNNVIKHTYTQLPFNKHVEHLTRRVGLVCSRSNMRVIYFRFGSFNRMEGGACMCEGVYPIESPNWALLRSSCNSLIYCLSILYVFLLDLYFPSFNRSFRQLAITRIKITWVDHCQCFHTFRS